jgi:IMP dehydrogenase
MAGSIFAGTDESPGEIVTIDGKKYKQYNGSTSLAEKSKHAKIANINFNDNYKQQIEGVESFVTPKGSVNEIIEKYTHNLRSGFSYSGARNISEFWKKAKFTQITSFGRRESEAHDVLVNSSKI